MLKMYCDLCGKPLSDNKSRNFKIKELKVSWHESWWQRIDAHDECVKKLFDSVKKNNESHETEIVRCKDCTYRGEISCPQYYRRTELSDNYFCADGKRRECVKPPTESATDWDGVECE